MRKAQCVVILAVLLTAATGNPALAAEKAPQKVQDLATSTLVQLGRNPAIVSAVRAENAKGKSVADLKDRQKKWMATPGVDGFMKALMENECARTLLGIQKAHPYLAEIFVKDNQGGNVAMTNKTTNYYHGDKDKFLKAFNDGRGALYLSDVQFDESSQAYSVQVSVPVMDGKSAIGVVIFGVDLDKFK